MEYITPEMIIKILLSILLGSLIGLERGKSANYTGLKTYPIVCLGTCIVGILGNVLDYNEPTCLARIAAGVISCIGLLGAGIIIKDENESKVVSLTTVAVIWFTSIIGLVIGTNYYILGVIGVIGYFITSFCMNKIENRFREPKKNILFFFKK